jgi:hypothetical protein
MPIDEERWGVQHSRALTLGGINDGRRQGGYPVALLRSLDCEPECVRPPWSRLVI